MRTAPETVVLGTGFAGLTAAVRLAEDGHRLRCHGDSAIGASQQNFGQLHSGAVYAPVLPEVAAACWQHRTRWFGLLGSEVSRSHGLALFSSHTEVERYTQAWSNFDIPVRPLSTRELDSVGVRPWPAPETAFALPDISVDVTALRARTQAHAANLGVPFAPPESCAPVLSGNEVILWGPSLGYYRPGTLVLAAGHRTVHLLDLLGIQHPLTINRLPYGVLEGSNQQHPLTYWLDGDMLALSPQPNGLHVALPGRPADPIDESKEHYRLAASLAERWPALPAEKLRLRWGQVAEPAGVQPDPSALVVDLSSPPPGWGQVANLIVCLPGKWTTAWHAADQVAQAVAARI
ncbi:FAD-dependent oxidoreductase [Kitasatospora aureofaciens]|uniref:FAD-dependent oxidoreductase n=1 Tax=Kitasatospora aureofaciens TaxID=1894 RepID=UPI001C4645C4|nr:FAD-dependent oxidoreductase [Kitasatospora aureofaciens]MBV6697398.1 FAD-dependent oxidoreductase [Kitasatospora aureofaciens]